MPSTPPATTRRETLAACGTVLFAGCTEGPAFGSSAPPVECGPEQSDWPAYGYDSARTSRVPERGMPPASDDARRFSQTGTHRNGGGSVDGPPVVDDGVAYVAGDVRVEARDVETGERRWGVDPEDSVTTSPALACGVAYVSTVNETLALDREDGSVLWRADAGSGTSSSGSPAAVDDTVYAVERDVVALDAESGEERWRARTGRSAQGIAVADRIYAGTGSNGDGGVVAMTRDGNEWWRTEKPGQVYTAPAVADGRVFAVSKTGTLTALDAADGTVLWQERVEKGIYSPPAVADGRVVVGAGNGTRAMALDAETGGRRWTYETGVGAGSPVVVGDRAILAGANTGFHVLDLRTGERVRRWPVENVGSQPVVADGRLFYVAWNVSDVFVVE